VRSGTPKGGPWKSALRTARLADNDETSRTPIKLSMPSRSSTKVSGLLFHVRDEINRPG